MHDRATQTKNIKLVEQAAKESGITLSRFSTDEDVELRYDLKQGTNDIAYMAKSWAFPGFVIGEVVIVPREYINQAPINMHDLEMCCIASKIECIMGGYTNYIEVQLSLVIFLDTFNASVFEEAITNLSMCVEKAERLFG